MFLLNVEGAQDYSAYRLELQVLPDGDARPTVTRTYSEGRILFDLRDVSEHELEFGLPDGNKDLFLAVAFVEVRDGRRRDRGDVLFSILMASESETVQRTFTR